MKQRKLLIVDSGLAAWLAGWSKDPAAPSTGRANEGLSLRELIRQASWLDPRIRFGHYRSKDGVEVDLVIEGPDRSVVGKGVKASETPRARDFRHLHHLRTALGPRFRREVVLHVGRTVASEGDGLVGPSAQRDLDRAARPDGMRLAHRRVEGCMATTRQIARVST